ncbi:hypothetical protein BpHYR1_021665 [Brachionus plicatilis]|uniref:Uncharacterized protein n=1 Tax=Brachionus plicatilis TaxID=10195 RepID=A0A3M7RUG9_BRAPC|nr:hypothetical protein BpHYR1_021665 [Brachionus plicatilis]
MTLNFASQTDLILKSINILFLKYGAKFSVKKVEYLSLLFDEFRLKSSSSYLETDFALRVLDLASSLTTLLDGKSTWSSYNIEAEKI